MWWAADVNESFHRSVAQDSQVNKSLEELSTAVTSKSYFAFFILLLLCLSQKLVFIGSSSSDKPCSYFHCRVIMCLSESAVF